MTELQPINTPEGMYQRLASGVSSALHGTADNFEVWHTESQPTDTGVTVHDFAFTDEDGTTWRGEFKLTLSGLSAYIEDEEDGEEWENDWYDDDEED